MGLDTVEILFSIEQAFGIDIPDEVAATLQTPGMVIDYIMSRQQAGTTFQCLSQRGFYRLRKALIDEGLANRDQLDPETDIETLLPREQRRQIWDRIQRKHHIALPRLARPRWLVISLMTLIQTGALIIAFATTDANELTLWVILLVALTGGLSANLLTRRMAIHLPKDCRKLGQLATYHSERFTHFLLEPCESLTREQIAQIVKAITLDYCDPKHYREDAYFVKDLGLD